MFELITYKNGVRPNRGKLNDFYDLPIEKQNIFKEIKNKVNNEFGNHIDLYVFGSYLKGVWNESSDFDVVTSEPNFKIRELKFKNIKVDFIYFNNFDGMVKIP